MSRNCNCNHNKHEHAHSKLPRAVDLDMVKCAKLKMNNGKEYVVKVDDLVAIQFVKNDEHILIRRGRVKDIVVINKRELSCPTDTVSHIILDCSEQFSVKILEIKFSDVIEIGRIDDELTDYTHRDDIEANHPVHDDKDTIGKLVNNDKMENLAVSSPNKITSRGMAIRK